MIRIDILSLSPEEAVMRIAGWVYDERDIELIAQEGNRCLGQSRLLVLDLEHLQQLSDLALPLLKGWQAEGKLQIRSWHYETGIKLRREGLIPKEEGRP